jgi:hypothetical protein
MIVRKYIHPSRGSNEVQSVQFEFVSNNVLTNAKAAEIKSLTIFIFYWLFIIIISLLISPNLGRRPS